MQGDTDAASLTALKTSTREMEADLAQALDGNRRLRAAFVGMLALLASGAIGLLVVTRHLQVG